MNSVDGRKRAIGEVENIINCVEYGVFPDFEIEIIKGSHQGRDRYCGRYRNT